MSYNSLFNKTKFNQFDRVKIHNIIGKIPKDISGSLFRNTSVCLERQGKRLNHWFDGDGAILKIKFQNSQVISSYKFVQTSSFKEEESQKRFIFPNIANMAHNNIEKWIYPNFPVNRSNTSVLPVQKKLLSLWEGGKPYALDLNSLETIGEDNLGFLKGNMAYSAHPKVDPDTGFIYNIGQRRGPGNFMDVYESDKSGMIQKSKKLKFDRAPNFIHDFCLAGDYLVFFTFPITLDIFPVLLRKKSIFEVLEFDEKSYCEIVVVSKKSFEIVGTIKTDPFFFFHFSNGYQNENGNLIFDLVEYKNFNIFKNYTSDVLKKDFSNEKKKDKANFSRFEVDIKNMKLVSKKSLLEGFNEFPIVQMKDVGKEYDKVFLNLADDGDFYMRNIARMDLKKEKIVKRKFEENVFPGEIIHIPNENNSNESGWVICVAYDANRNKSVVHLMNEDTLENVAQFDLPDLTSHSFHGYWRSEKGGVTI